MRYKCIGMLMLVYVDIIRVEAASQIEKMFTEHRI